MSVRLPEVHPAIVHFPIATLPIAVTADLLGRATGNRSLSETGRLLMPVAAAGAALAAVTGLVAQEEVRADGRALDLLVTHRNLNLVLTAAAAALATWRWTREDAPRGYLALALAGIGALSYSAYLGGRMVYDYGVGVEAAGGVRDADSPELTPARAREVARRVVDDVERGIPHVIEDLRHGRIAPALRRGGGSPPDERRRLAEHATGGAAGPGSPESMP